MELMNSVLLSQTLIIMNENKMIWMGTDLKELHLQSSIRLSLMLMKIVYADSCPIFTFHTGED
jgi:hypothetical protein